MKKHNEGYALPYVLVVFLIISLIAVSILSVSLNNLQSQKASIQRMEEQYVAQGEIEKVEALLGNMLNKNNPFISEGILVSDIKDVVNCTVGSPVEIKTDNKIKELTLTVVSEKETVQICAVFKITGSEIKYDETQAQYGIEDPVLTYDSYTISAIEPSTEPSTEEVGGATQ